MRKRYLWKIDYMWCSENGERERSGWIGETKTIVAASAISAYRKLRKLESVGIPQEDVKYGVLLILGLRIVNIKRLSRVDVY